MKKTYNYAIGFNVMVHQYFSANHELELTDEEHAELQACVVGTEAVDYETDIKEKLPSWFIERVGLEALAGNNWRMSYSNPTARLPDWARTGLNEAAYEGEFPEDTDPSLIDNLIGFEIHEEG